jgi:hypothetical protein
MARLGRSFAKRIVAITALLGGLGLGFGTPGAGAADASRRQLSLSSAEGDRTTVVTVRSIDPCAPPAAGATSVEIDVFISDTGTGTEVPLQPDGSWTLDVGPFGASGVFRIGALCPGSSSESTRHYDGKSFVVPAEGHGYYLQEADGETDTFGDANGFGIGGRVRVTSPDRSYVAVAAQRGSSKGWWRATSDGGVFSSGAVDFFGSARDVHLRRPIVGMAATPSGRGYWLVGADGGVFAFGDAPFLGSAAGRALRRPAVGIERTPSGHGYWLVMADGGVLTFGDAQFLGSAGDRHLNAAIVGMSATPSGLGYWLFSADGGVFTFGEAPFAGSATRLRLRAPIVGGAGTTTGAGYWLAGADGGVFAFGDAQFMGIGGYTAVPVTAIAST